MFVYICQNQRKVANVGYDLRSKEELDEEYAKISEMVNAKYNYPSIFRNEDRTATARDNTIKDKTVYNLGLDLSILSCFGENDLVIFSSHHYEDRFCNIVQEVAQAYGIRYEVMK